VKIRCTVNGTRRELDVPPMARLLDVLREDLRLTGTKEGCGEGECGACTVLLNGLPVNSCLVPAAQVEGAKVVTVEGLGGRGHLSVLQEAFLHGAAQCGICTPGILVTAQALIDQNPRPTEADIREALAGNLCRCTGYVKIVEAVRKAARLARAGGGARPAAKKSAAARRAGAPKPARRKSAARPAAKKAASRKSAAKPAVKSAKKAARRKAARRGRA